jgi:hypothetical protein
MGSSQYKSPVQTGWGKPSKFTDANNNTGMTDVPASEDHLYKDDLA